MSMLSSRFLFIRLIWFSVILLSLFCGQSKAKAISPAVRENVVRQDTVSYDKIGRLGNGILLVEHDVHLNGSVCVLPKGMTLRSNGGTLKNGTIIGHDTKIVGKDVLFDKVRIEGTWVVPDISTKMFADLSYENALRDVAALANPKVQNRIRIEKGDYIVAARKNGDVCIPLVSNTDVVMNGTVRLLPNSYKSYSIIQMKGRNIHLSGKGSIIGDKHTHTGSTGEWGMGIRFSGAVDSSVKRLTIKDCWGDCMYVGGNSRNILIEHCLLDHGRRQGISITKAKGVTIRHCIISNVGGKNPQYAIDLEPNKGDTVTKIVIEKVEVKGCEGGILATKPSAKQDTLKTSKIGDIVIRDCKIAVLSKYPLNLKGSESALVERCTISSANSNPSVYIRNVNHTIVRNNTISFNKTILRSAENHIRAALGKQELKPITIIRSKTKQVTNNKLIEQ